MNVRLESVEGFVAIHAHHDDDDNERQQQVEWVHGLFQACPKLAPSLPLEICEICEICVRERFAWPAGTTASWK